MEYTFNGEPLGQDPRSSSSFCTPPGSPLLSSLSLAEPETHANDCKKTKRRIKSEPIHGPAVSSNTIKNDVKGNHVKKRHSKDVSDLAEETSVLILQEEETEILLNHVGDVSPNPSPRKRRLSVESTVWWWRMVSVCNKDWCQSNLTIFGIGKRSVRKEKKRKIFLKRI